MTDDIVPWSAPERPKRSWQALTAVAGVPLLAVPVDLILANWVSGAVDRKAECSTSLPGYQTALAGLVPLLFVVLALACGVAGTVTLVRGRRRHIPAQRYAGRTALIISVPALLVAIIFAVPPWFAVGFSTWCF